MSKISVIVVWLLQAVSFRIVKGIFEPTDVGLNTLNLQTVISWRAPVIDNNTHTVGLYYQVESKNFVSDRWDVENACQHILMTFCTMKQMKIADIAMGFPIYARVRASLPNLTSNWVETHKHKPSEEGIIAAPSINNISMLNNDTLILDLSFPETPYYKSGTGWVMRANDGDFNLGVQANIRVEELEVEETISPPYRISNVHLQQNIVYTVTVSSVVAGRSSPVPNIKRFEKKGKNIYIREEIQTSTQPDEAAISIKSTTTTVHSSTEYELVYGLDKKKTTVKSHDEVSRWAVTQTAFTCAVTVILLVLGLLISVTVVKRTCSYEHRSRFQLPQWFSKVVTEYKSTSLPRQTGPSEVFDELKSRPNSGYLEVVLQEQQIKTCQIEDQDSEPEEEQVIKQDNCVGNVVILRDNDYIQANFFSQMP